MATPLLLGIEIGGTKLQLGLGRGDGRVEALERRTVVPGDGAEGIRAQIVEALGPLLGAGRRRARPRRGRRRSGSGSAGPVDADRGVVSTSHQIDGWDRFPLADWLRGRVGVERVSVQNDADTAGLAEARFGAGVGFSPLLYVTVGSGIGGGLILDGKVYRGAGAGAMEIGHLWVIDRTDADLGVVTLERAASGWAIAAVGPRLRRAARRRGAGRRLGRPPPRRGRPERDHRPGTSPRPPATATARPLLLLDRAVNAMAHGLAQAVTLVAPHRIILGGGVSLIGEDLWLGPIRDHLDRLVFPPFRGKFDLVAAALGEEVVVQGALALARDALEAASDATSSR